MAKMITKARELRLNLGAQRGTPVTLQEVADATGLERGALNKIELGKSTPTPLPLHQRPGHARMLNR